MFQMIISPLPTPNKEHRFHPHSSKLSGFQRQRWVKDQPTMREEIVTRLFVSQPISHEITPSL